MDARIDDEVERRTAELHDELDAQRRRVREMGHRVKNNLQTLSALSLLNARRTEEGSARRALLGMAERIAALSAAYRFADPSGEEGVDASALVSEIAADLVASVEGNRVALALDIEPLTVSADSAAPLALLVNELIANTLRHDFPARCAGRLTITVRCDADGTRLTISSDRSERPPAEPPGDAFGRTLCEMFARQIKAELTFEEAGRGTRAVVLMPEGREG
jgi:two-component sensor histidine kinase